MAATSSPHAASGPDAFHGRERELQVLLELADSRKAELYVLFGRRRVGKTELLQRLCERRRAVYFLAAQVRDKDNLRAFKHAVLEETLEPIPLIEQRRVPRLVARRSDDGGRARRAANGWSWSSTSSPTCAKGTGACPP